MGTTPGTNWSWRPELQLGHPHRWQGFEHHDCHRLPFPGTIAGSWFGSREAGTWADTVLCVHSFTAQCPVLWIGFTVRIKVKFKWSHFASVKPMTKYIKSRCWALFHNVLSTCYFHYSIQVPNIISLLTADRATKELHANSYIEVGWNVDDLWHIQNGVYELLVMMLPFCSFLDRNLEWSGLLHLNMISCQYP